MLLSKTYIINVTSRNIVKWKELKGDCVVRGPLEVTSYEIIRMGVTKFHLDCVCDRCRKEYNVISCKARTNPNKLSLCACCIQSDAQKSYYQTDAGKDKLIRGTQTRINNNEWRESMSKTGEKSAKWFSEQTDEYKSNWAKSMSIRMMKYPVGDPRRDEIKVYTRMVRRETKKSHRIYSTWENFDKIGRSGVVGAYQIDHVIPIKYGFDNGICPSVIGHINNLQIIPWEQNRSKWDKYKD